MKVEKWVGHVLTVIATIVLLTYLLMPNITFEDVFEKSLKCYNKGGQPVKVKGLFGRSFDEEKTGIVSVICVYPKRIFG